MPRHVPLVALALAPVETAAQAQTPLRLDDPARAYPLGAHAEVLDDPTGTLTLDAVRTSMRFAPAGADFPVWGLARSVR